MFEQFDSPRAQALAHQRKELAACVLAHVYSILHASTSRNIAFLTSV